MRWARRRTYLTPPPRRPPPTEQKKFVAAVKGLFVYWLLHLFLNLF